ncbi:YcjF family protein [Methylocystis parvus]|uniref:TIGR01620 family protein n=1 Tax=Methylocystis parvus TaxID=134 RepID=A0A6B8M269_9HYPH|nr:TIGR01620 family protein [Methylocystis parvus]QGM98947.1 TIGR01620 family protein [Methylocystis parvus]WBK00695.1 TIGR01620 family protein [Methylocystis parvus OBBP]
MSNSERRPRPRAFRLNGDETVTSKPSPQVEPEDDIFAEAAELIEGAPGGEAAADAARAKGILDRYIFSSGGVFFSALTGLITLALSIWVWNFVEDLFARSPILGAIGLALASAAGVAALLFIAREIRSIMLQNRIAKLHAALGEARAANDGPAAKTRVLELCRIYESRADLARPRALVADYAKQIMDGKDLVDLAERNLVAPLDEQARREIAGAAKRVSVVTAVSPRAVLDIIFVAGQAIVLMRRISEIYGGRPGLLGFFKLARSVGAHLAITGTIAVGDTLLQQVLGHGVAARISAKLGEGVLNGLLTARVGLSAMAVCRPTPFVTESQPGVKDVAPFLLGGDKTKAN